MTEIDLMKSGLSELVELRPDMSMTRHYSPGPMTAEFVTGWIDDSPPAPIVHAVLVQLGQTRIVSVQPEWKLTIR